MPSTSTRVSAPTTRADAGAAVAPASVAGVLGIDIGGTKVALRIEPAATGTAAPVEATFQWQRAVPALRDVDDLATQVGALLSRWAGPVGAVGVAMPGTVDAAGLVTTWPGRPSWTGLAFVDMLRALVPGAAVAHADDGDVAALAEAAAAGRSDIVYIGVGTGIGGGIVLGGRPCPGPARGSAEVGHMVIAMDGPPCTCGRRGCVQALACGPATLRRAILHRDADTTATADGDVGFAELRASWLDGRDWAVRAVRESAAAVAVAVTGLAELLHPDLAVVGGGFADGLPGFTDAVAEHTQALGRPGHPPVPVQAAVLGGLSSLAGAILLGRQAGEGTEAADR
jgi:kanosamine 6-kinase